MVTRDVLKVLKLHSPTARAILRAFKTSLVPINHEMHSRSYDFLYLSHFYQNALHLTRVQCTMATFNQSALRRTTRGCQTFSLGF